VASITGTYANVMGLPTQKVFYHLTTDFKWNALKSDIKYYYLNHWKATLLFKSSL
jgi:hypothetical protein